MAITLPTSEALKNEKAKRSFRYFLNYWQFINRETGQVQSFEQMWESQEIAARYMQEHPWLFLLKAGKLGATELECAFDGWRLRYGRPRSRVHLFSLGYESAKELLKPVKFGLENLPEWMRWPVGALAQSANNQQRSGLDTTREFVIANPNDARADIRRCVSYPVVKNVSIDQSCQHAHLDELSHIPIAKELWDGVTSTVAPDGTCHVVSRGAGEQVFTAKLWKMAETGESRLTPCFIPWNARADRGPEWYQMQANTLTPVALKYFAPETAADALASPEENVYLPIALWDLCAESLPPLDSETPCVVALDAATTQDSYHMAVVSRHPSNPRKPALRYSKNWNPKDFDGHRVRHREIEQEIVDFTKTHNVVQIAYDPFQLESFADRGREEGFAWFKPFSQTNERTDADSELHALVTRREFAHNGDQLTREHIKNARALVDKTFPDKVRIIKSSDKDAKVDAAVATAMAVKRCLELNLA